MSYFGFKGGIKWPFFSWHLYGYNVDKNIKFYELYVADDEGTEIKYDARAVPPTLTTPLRRLAERMTTMSEVEINEIGTFLYKGACSYRQKIKSGSISLKKLVKFPSHQFGFKWDVENLNSLNEFTCLRVYKVKAELSEDGTTLIGIEREKQLDLRFK